MPGLAGAAIKPPPPLRVVLHEGEGSAPLQPARRVALLRSLLERGYPVTITSAGGRGGVAPADGSDLVVLGEFTAQGSAAWGQAVTSAAAGAPDSGVKVRFGDLSGLDAAAAVKLVDGVREELGAPAPGGWKPWFPVIDYKRCTNCMQCLSFCLFDVYGVDSESNIQVRNPQKCKTNCPACSRVCPEVAILFPKYTGGPINGAEVDALDVQREKMKVDISALLGGDIYSLLRERHKRAQSRFSKERDEGKALKERMRCLQELQASLDIPPEVLMALPSAEEIRERAGRAAAAALAQEPAGRAAPPGAVRGAGSEA